MERFALCAASSSLAKLKCGVSLFSLRQVGAKVASVCCCCDKLAYKWRQFVVVAIGWRNSLSSSWFVKYAEFCFQTFGDRVKSWVTIYDPYSVAWKGYGSGEHAPGMMHHV